MDINSLTNWLGQHLRRAAASTMLAVGGVSNQLTTSRQDDEGSGPNQKQIGQQQQGSLAQVLLKGVRNEQTEQYRERFIQILEEADRFEMHATWGADGPSFKTGKKLTVDQQKARTMMRWNEQTDQRDNYPIVVGWTSKPLIFEATLEEAYAAAVNGETVAAKTIPNLWFGYNGPAPAGFALESVAGYAHVKRLGQSETENLLFEYYLNVPTTVPLYNLLMSTTTQELYGQVRTVCLLEGTPRGNIMRSYALTGLRSVGDFQDRPVIKWNARLIQDILYDYDGAKVRFSIPGVPVPQPTFPEQQKLLEG